MVNDMPSFPTDIVIPDSADDLCARSGEDRSGRSRRRRRHRGSTVRTAAVATAGATRGSESIGGGASDPLLGSQASGAAEEDSAV